MGELREFVYIDESSLNNALSSLGKGVPDVVTEAVEDVTAKGGSGGAKAFSVGAEAEYSSSDRTEIETQLKVTAPYRFQELIEELENQDIDVHQNPDTRSLSRGKIVRVEGDVYGLGLLKFEMALSAFSPFTDEDLNEAMNQLSGDVIFEESDKRAFENFYTVLKKFSTNQYPINIIGNDSNIYCAQLDRQYMLRDIYDVFSENQKFTLFGRVKQEIPSNESWHALQALKLIEKYAPGEDEIAESIEEIGKNSDEFNISMDSSDFEVRGHTVVIEPIALYW